ncbi:hypothetical protein BV25DRAFT_1827396 [Artomyces pyxidatus]|uniref:Uncharacterized protein n=1 Tax=Artomyces pyxidatus TaxID=48021 RepID=A0ACB8SY62_9AGAM|nr:hypothetical protein BV25DRAFT_1827396 [Artomyces pyxidatus]
MSSDDGDVGMEDDDDEGEDFMLNDELFKRIMASASRKQQHSYRVSYQLDVGSSIDPDMYDITAWEQELRDAPNDDDEVRPPSEYDDEAEELAAYAEEAALWEELEAQADDIFSLSDLEDTQSVDEDVEMR